MIGKMEAIAHCRNTSSLEQKETCSYFLKQIDDFSIQIKDAQGHIVYTEAHLSLPAKGVYPILIGDWTNGLYTVTLCQDGKYAVYQFTK